MAEHRIELLEHGVFASGVIRNPSPAALYEDAVAIRRRHAHRPAARSIANSGAKTGRSPKDKRIVETADDASSDVWWGAVNIRLSPQSFRINRKRAIDYLDPLPAALRRRRLRRLGPGSIGSRSASSARGRITRCSCTTC